MNPNRLVAHRGDNTHYPENSYAGIEAALLAGAHFVEFDIQMNADKSLIVIHDPDFKRTANINESLFSTNDHDLKSISVHEPKRFGEQHYPTHIPHLSEVLELLKRYPKAHYFVEVKIESLKQWGLSEVMDKLLSTLNPYRNQITIISFSAEALEYTHTHSKLNTGFVFRQYDKRTQKIAKKLKPRFLICSFLIIPGHDLWKGDWQWMTYSLNDTEIMQQTLKRKDIQLIETDDISLMIQAQQN